METADARTLETLDFARVRERVASNARSERGKERAAELAPLRDLARVRFEQSATSAIRDLVESNDMHVLPARDTARMTGAARRGAALDASDVRAVGEALAAAAEAANRTKASDNPILIEITGPYRPLQTLARSILDAVDERGAVLDRASPALMRIRKRYAQAQVDARDRVSALLRSAKYAKAIQDSIVTIREGRFVVPIKAEFAGEVPGIVHDTSSSGQTLFVEPLSALDANNSLRTLRLEEEREIARILAAFARAIGDEAEQIEANVDVLARIDVLVAKATVARAMDAVEPEIADAAVLDVAEGRHPLLGERAVPQSISIDESRRFIVISGPNMGGKTVALKMVGLFVMMAYSGMHLPAARKTRIGWFTRVITDIGDEQSIAANASTFSAHLDRMRDILGNADSRTLVLIDEIGGGTEPASGAALAVAMLERLLFAQSSGIVTTHSTELKLFASATVGIANASVRFDPQTFAPTYQLDIGMPGQSLAFPLARTLGIDGQLIARAEALLSDREREYEKALEELAVANARLQQTHDVLATEREHVRLERTQMLSDAAALDSERREFGQRAEERLQQGLRDFAAELERRAGEKTRAKITNAQSALLSRTLDAVRSDLHIYADVPTQEQRAGLCVGDAVRVSSYGQEGRILEDFGDTVLVAIGSMKTVVAKTDVVPSSLEQSRNRSRPRDQAGSAKLEAAQRTSLELDVRGKRYVEAEPLVDRWIDEAALGGVESLRLIHGKGTGMLGRGLQSYLREHPGVVNVRYGDENEGGGGVTVFELR
ncbi:MAG: endonuclease MutS2 [Candidatus Eremiobacteraeota bacterium]|nr:endonuclease MutS2 [Candidatus Eremiobacteraeota bacterium]